MGRLPVQRSKTPRPRVGKDTSRVVSTRIDLVTHILIFSFTNTHWCQFQLCWWKMITTNDTQTRAINQSNQTQQPNTATKHINQTRQPNTPHNFPQLPKTSPNSTQLPTTWISEFKKNLNSYIMKNLCQLDDGKSQMTKIPKKLSLALNEVADLPDICEIPDIYEVEDLICDVQIFSAKICNFVVFQSSLRRSGTL